MPSGGMPRSRIAGATTSRYSSSNRHSRNSSVSNPTNGFGSRHMGSARGSGGSIDRRKFI
jgi:hypothetical protein